MSYTNGLDKPTDYFNTKLYTGNGTAKSITGVGFQPDWVWIKDRDNANSHRLFDGVRGIHKKLFSNSTSAEVTDVNSLTSFTADGFDSGSDSGMNGSGVNFVSWNWLASNSTASNTDGSITSTVSANTTSGFSIVSYTGNGSAGATIGHGLGVTPKFIIVKGRDTASNWQVGHSSLGWTQSIRLNQDGASASRTISWNDTDPTSSVFSVGTDSDCNTNTDDYIAYCFAEKKGFSKFGSYTGNGSTDGTFVYTGFKPAFVMVKRTDSAQAWGMFDDKRDTFNPVMKRLEADVSDAERTDLIWYDFLSNGFKPKQSYNLINASGGTYIYMAFAESPFVTSTGIPATAR
jgi:hypothetical protein